MAVADLAHRLEVTGRRRDDAVRPGHGLEDHGGDVLRPFVLEDLLEVRRARADRARIGMPRRAAVRVRVEHADHPGNARLGGPAAWIARRRDRARGRAVVGAVARHDLVPSRKPARELDRVLVRLGAAVREERHRQVARRHLREEPRQLGALLVRHHRPDRAEPVRLLLDRGDHLRVLVPERDVDELGREVEVALAVEVPEVAALGACNRDRVDRGAHRPGVEDVARVVALDAVGVGDGHYCGNSDGIGSGGVPMTIAISRPSLSSISCGSPS